MYPGPLNAILLNAVICFLVKPQSWAFARVCVPVQNSSLVQSVSSVASSSEHLATCALQLLFGHFSFLNFQQSFLNPSPIFYDTALLEVL